MGKPKKLDLSLDKLKEIAIEINKNTIANRDRSKEDKIPTDKFIRKFDILRKDFSETIKDTCILYNRNTFLYDIDEEVGSSNTSNTISNTISNTTSNTSNTMVTPKAIDSNIGSNTKVTPKKTNNDVIEVLRDELPEIFEIIDLYKKGLMKEEVVKDKDNNIFIEKEKLSGEVITRSIKIYKGVIDSFSQFCKDKKESQKDLLAIALIEFMEKYK